MQLSQLIKTCILGDLADDEHFAVPSAGAIFPYQLLAALTHEGDTTFLPPVDIDDAEGMVRDIDRFAPDHVTIYILFQPEKVMKKYGERGILYGSQDCGHLLASLFVGAKSAGVPVRARVFSDSRQSTRVCSGKAITVMAGIGLGAPSIDPFQSSLLLQLKKLVPSVVTPSSETSLDSSKPGDRLSKLHIPNVLLSDGDGWRSFEQATLSRRSATCFEGQCLGLETVSALGHMALGQRPEQDVVNDFGLSFYLSVKSETAGWRTFSFGEKLTPLGKAKKFEPSRIVEILSGQEFTRTTSAMITFDADVKNKDDLLMSGIWAGIAGQIFYLCAALQKIPICCVGGFEFHGIAEFLGLKATQSPIYTMLLGAAAKAEIKKVDREAAPLPRSLDELLDVSENGVI